MSLNTVSLQEETCICNMVTKNGNGNDLWQNHLEKEKWQWKHMAAWNGETWWYALLAFLHLLLECHLSAKAKMHRLLERHLSAKAMSLIVPNSEGRYFVLNALTIMINFSSPNILSFMQFGVSSIMECMFELKPVVNRKTYFVLLEATASTKDSLTLQLEPTC